VRETEEERVYNEGELEPVYSDIPQSDHEMEDEHIYEDFGKTSRTPVLRKAGIQPSLKPEDEDKRKTITLTRNVKGLVKEKVETYEGIIQGAEVVVECPDTSLRDKTCPDPIEPCPSFQIKSGSGASGDSKSPFDL